MICVWSRSAWTTDCLGSCWGVSHIRRDCSLRYREYAMVKPANKPSSSNNSIHRSHYWPVPNGKRTSVREKRQHSNVRNTWWRSAEQMTRHDRQKKGEREIWIRIAIRHTHKQAGNDDANFVLFLSGDCHNDNHTTTTPSSSQLAKGHTQWLSPERRRRSEKWREREDNIQGWWG